MNFLKTTLIAFCMTLFCLECSAQADVWVWQRGAYYRMQNVDSVTFIEHAYVDLGLKSGRLWATCNVGAFKPQESGDLFAWGETFPKDDYQWDNYKFLDLSYKFTKYCVESVEGVVDNKTVLESVDDAATANWGSEWRMPTNDDFVEIQAGCTWAWTDDYKGTGTDGLIGTSKTNGNTIFFPVPSIFRSYWSSSLCYADSDKAYVLSMSKSGVECYYGYGRCDGNYVRAVKK